MPLLQQAQRTYHKWYWIILFFSLFATITFEAVKFTTNYDFWPSDMKRMTWGTDVLSNAIENLQKGLAVNVITAIPQIIVGIALILVQVLVNSILLINWIINKTLQLIFMMVMLPPDTANTISAILAWILEAPLIIGLVMDLGQIIYTLLPFGR